MKFFRSTLTILSILTVCLIGSGRPVIAGDDVDCLKDARIAFREGDYQTAIELYTCAIEEDTENYAAYLGRGEAYVLAAPPLSDAVFLDYGTAAFGDFTLLEEAIEDYTDEIGDEPERVEPYVLRAFMYYLLGDFEGVLEDTETILELDAENSVAYLVRGLTNHILGNPEDASADFEQAIELDPNNPVVLNLIAYSYYSALDYENAIVYYSALIEVDPENLNAYYQRGLSYASLEDYEAAIADYTQVIELDDQYIDVYFSRGLAYYSLGDYEAALEDFNYMIEVTGGNASVFQVRGSTLLALGENEAGAADYLTYSELIGFDIRDAEKLEVDEPIEIDMNYGVVYNFEFFANEGQTITIVAESPDDVDSLIILLGPDGNPLMGNDDRDGPNLDFNAEIRDFVAPATGTYTLVVTHAYANPVGRVEVGLEISD